MKSEDDKMKNNIDVSVRNMKKSVSQASKWSYNLIIK